MKKLIPVVMILALACGVAAASVTVQNFRISAMGMADVGLADDDAAFASNPAGIPYIKVYGPRISPWPSRVSGTFSMDGDVDSFGAFYSVRNAASTQGWGVGYWNADSGAADVDGFGGGYGVELSGGLSGGVSLLHTTNASDQTVVNVGGMYRVDAPMSSWSYGALLRDLTDESGAGPMCDLGASVTLPSGLLVTGELQDVTDEVDTVFNVGAEWPMPMTAFTIRGGAADGDLTLGVGYRLTSWEIGAAWLDSDGGDDQWLIGAAGSF
ncbi:MAG: hypothetical protein U9R79_06340 [Armatimonadota bacterium]|nr:hypothetical protein [Armatimonadota bacterium]